MRHILAHFFWLSDFEVENEAWKQKDQKTWILCDKKPLNVRVKVGLESDDPHRYSVQAALGANLMYFDRSEPRSSDRQAPQNIPMGCVPITSSPLLLRVTMK
jgi:hypothetical protein